MTHLGRILIVDDEPKIGSFIGRALTAAGYATEFAASGAEALRSCAAARYDLVILDLVITDMDGREVLGELLSARPDQAGRAGLPDQAVLARRAARPGPRAAAGRPAPRRDAR